MCALNREIFRRRDLPHWDMPGAAYCVTTCLVDSIPAKGLLDLQRFNSELSVRSRPADVAESDWAVRKWKLGFARAERWLDSHLANAALHDPRLARIVMNARLHFAGIRYDLLAFVVMPSHVHWVFQPKASWVATLTGPRSARESVVHSINRSTARECNIVCQSSGAFWQRESYDHWVRDEDELERIIHYVEDNPVKAGLVANAIDWTFSSGCMRKKLGLEFGAPIEPVQPPTVPNLGHPAS
jgi:REP element-mobilizing transposase RayT